MAVHTHRDDSPKFVQNVEYWLSDILHDKIEKRIKVNGIAVADQNKT